MSQNPIETFEALETLQFGVLETVYLEHTPIYDLPEYREKCLALLPSVKQLDSYSTRAMG